MPVAIFALCCCIASLPLILLRTSVRVTRVGIVLAWAGLLLAIFAPRP